MKTLSRPRTEIFEREFLTRDTRSIRLTTSSTSGGHRFRGFTLIEVIVAMLIATMIVAVVFSGLGIAFDAWARTTARVAELETGRYAWRTLRRQLEAALPLSTVIEEGLTRSRLIAFEGEPGTIRFVSHSTFSMGATGPARWVEWEVVDDGLRVREYDIVPPDNRPASEPAWEGVLGVGPDAGSLEFAYLGPRTPLDLPDSAGDWVDEWRPRTGRTIPRAVRIRTSGTGAPRSQAMIALAYAGSAAQGLTLE